jgi:hypothetical protein
MVIEFSQADEIISGLQFKTHSGGGLRPVERRTTVQSDHHLREYSGPQPKSTLQLHIDLSLTASCRHGYFLRRGNGQLCLAPSRPHPDMPTGLGGSSLALSPTNQPLSDRSRPVGGSRRGDKFPAPGPGEEET